MRSLVLMLASALFASAALGAIPHVDCNSCTTLREFGNFGAASLYRASGPFAPAVGNDRIWVDNDVTGRSVFVDLDTPLVNQTFMGTQVPLPDLTQLEVNATWADGSGSGVWVLPIEVVAAIAASIEAAEARGTPEVTPEEFDDLPGLSPDDVWRLFGLSGGGNGFLTSGSWLFLLSGHGGPTPIVTIVECAWHSGC